MSNGDDEFEEFAAVAWPRVYRTTYVVAGRHALTQDAVQRAFSDAYINWERVLDSGDPESEVSAAAIEVVLLALRKATKQVAPSAFGPLMPHGNVICASPEERSRIDDLWAELQALEATDRAVVALAAASASSPGQVVSSDRPRADKQRLVDFLVTYLDEVLVQGADLEGVIKQGSDRRRRRRWVVGVVAAALFAMVAIPVALFAPREKAVSTNDIGRWREAAESPLTPRWSSLATWTGSEALFIGGRSQESCASPSSCRGLRDGAAYDPKRDTWRPIAQAPFQMVTNSPHAQSGDQLYVAGPRWVRYDASEDEWTELPSPPVPYAGGILAAMGDSIFAVGSGTRDPIQVFNGATDRWSVLPRSPGTPRLRYRNLVGTASGLVVLGIDGQELRSELSVPPQWIVNPDGVKGGHSLRWSWTGERLILAEIVAVYGANGKRDGVRFAGGLTLDPESGRWGYLPIAPAAAQVAEPWELYAEGGPLVAADGYVYDDRNGIWATLSRPAQAPRIAVASVWAGGELMAFGGAGFTGVDNEISDSTNRLWIYTPQEP